MGAFRWNRSVNHLEPRPRQRDLADPIHLTKFSEAAHEHSRPRSRTNCELTLGPFVPLLFESQSGTLACNGAVFSDCSERIVGNTYRGRSTRCPDVRTSGA